MSRRSAVDVSGGAQPSTEEFSIARQVVKKSRLVAALEAHVGSKVGRPRHLSLEGLLVAMQVNALRRHHRAHVVQAARTLNAMNARAAKCPRDTQLGAGRGLFPCRLAVLQAL